MKIFRTQIYTDLRRKLFPQIIQCLAFNFRFSAKIIFKILIICVHLRPIIKIILSCVFAFSACSAVKFKDIVISREKTKNDSHRDHRGHRG